MNTQNNLFVSLLISLVGLFILVFFTLWSYSQLQATWDEYDGLTSKLASLKEKETNLNKNKQEIASGKNKEIEKYIFEFKEDSIVKYIYSFVQQNATSAGYSMIVNNLSLDEGGVNEYGFTEGKINLDMRVAWEMAMMNLIDFLTAKDAPYQFFIESFSYPNNGVDGVFSVSIPLKVFYK